MNDNIANNATWGNQKLFRGILAGVIIGIILGGVVNIAHLYVLEIIGELFMKALFMIVIPLVLCSIISGITDLGDLRHLGAIGWKTLLYYMVTTAIAVIIGLILVNLIKPGSGVVHGENLPHCPYSITAEKPHQVTLETHINISLSDSRNWELVLLDQPLHGRIIDHENNLITVDRWETTAVNHRVETTAQKGSHLRPVQPVNDREFIPDVSKGNLTGIGIKIRPVADVIAGKKDRTIKNVLREVITGLFPANIFKSMSDGDILPLIVFSLLFACALSSLGNTGQPAIAFINSCNDAIMKLVWWILLTAPIGIMSLIAVRIAGKGGFVGFWPELIALGKYVLTVVAGLAIHGMIVLPLILKIIGKRDPREYFRNMSAALLNAFSTASSSATLPLTMEGVQQFNGVSRRSASFVLPMGATINMDGTALYEAVAAVFIAQVYGIDMGPVQVVVIFLTATLAAIGAAGIPEAGLVTMVLVLNAVGLPLEGIGLIVSIDWLLDRFRTTINVWGDAVGAAVIDRLEQP